MRLTIHYLISGFTQTIGRWHGLVELAERFRKLGHNSGPERTEYYPWRADWSDVAEHALALAEQYDTRPVIGIYAYSWGGGWGAPQLARQLGRRDLKVDTMVLSDPVYCHRWLALRWRAMTNWDWPFVPQPKIVIPANVREVRSFYQEENRPRAHRLVAEGCHTVIHQPRRLTCTHQYMDNAAEFHQTALAFAAALRAKAKA